VTARNPTSEKSDIKLTLLIVSGEFFYYIYFSIKQHNHHEEEKTMFIKGVNLGNWLVLEKWMSPHLFDGTTAEDEYYLPTQLSKEVYEARMLIHRSEYITERDFAKIASIGLTHVRIPVP
jgi:aryl-phospho-beta-D-glucosidase BglC (GH1 family)